MEEYKSQIIDDIFNDIPQDKLEDTGKRMKLAAKIADGMEAKGWKNVDLMEALGKRNPSIISKWLSGTHHFTTKTLIELEKVLEIKLYEKL